MPSISCNGYAGGRAHMVDRDGLTREIVAKVGIVEGMHADADTRFCGADVAAEDLADADLGRLWSSLIADQPQRDHGLGVVRCLCPHLNPPVVGCVETDAGLLLPHDGRGVEAVLARAGACLKG